jgi:putative sigma-54 modulation protein
MKLTFSGKTKEFTPEVEEKLGKKLAKLSKFLETRGEREAHISHRSERHLHKVQVSVNFYDHVLVGEGADTDLDVALCDAVEKIEKQIVNLRKRWRDTHRDPAAVRSSKEQWESNGAVKVAREPDPSAKKNNSSEKPRIFRVNYQQGRKPMTVEEAMLEALEDREEYVVFRNVDRDCVSVLVRRSDGNFDLIES